MSKIDNGGPASPVSTSDEISGHQDGPNTWQFPGMTLRDYFAAKAMQGLCSASPLGIPGGADVSDGRTVIVLIARTAYMMADAMLKERERK